MSAEAKQALWALIDEQQVGISFVEMRRALRAAQIDPDGDMAMEFPGKTNLFIWAGMSKAFFDGVVALLDERRIKLVSTTPLVYMCDGETLSFPLARRACAYKAPHWVPMVVSRAKDARV